MNVQILTKPVSFLVAMIMLLTPILSSASVLWFDESAPQTTQHAEPRSMMLESCHEQAGDESSTDVTDASLQNCCQEQCQCSQMSCQTSAATLSQAGNATTDDKTRFNFISSTYHSPFKSPSSPPPIS